MVERMKEFLRYAVHIRGDETFILGVSGGMDSVVMANLFREAGMKYGIAHCHFGLRGEEADKDAAFVESLAANHKVPFYLNHFDTNQYAINEGISIQEAARELRFAWFDTLAEKYGYDHIAVAHHKDDEIETFFINLLRGTGIHGLKGLDPISGRLIHPLLFASRDEILRYATSKDLLYREDQSNFSDKYLRNRIRHELVPLLESFRQGARQRIYSNIARLREESGLLDHHLLALKQEYQSITSEGWLSFSLPKNLPEPGLVAFTHYMLAPYGFSFSQAAQVSRAWFGEPGRQFSSPTHVCLIDRNRLIVRNKSEEETGEYTVDGEQNALSSPFQAIISHIPIAELSNLDQGSSVALLDLDRLRFPLKIRRWKPGDAFQPLGMLGKRKLSDFFVDEKLSLFEKEAVWVLESAGKIAWICGYRIDHRFRVTRKTKWILRIEIMQNR